MVRLIKKRRNTKPNDTNRLVISFAVVIAAIICLLLLAFFGKEAGATVTSNQYMKFPDFDPYAEEGTEENPFIILELVPYRGMGQIGYLVGGQEPVDISLSTYENPLWGPVDAVARGAFEVVRKPVLETGDDPSEWTHYSEQGCYMPSNQWCFRNKEVFKRQVLHISEERLETYQVRVVTLTPAELKENVNKFSKYYDLNDNGKYNKQICGANEQGEIDLIAHADLISLSPRAQAGSETIVNLWESYGRDTSGMSTFPDRYNQSFKDNDLDWKTTMELFMKLGVVEQRAALVYDITCITAPSGSTETVRGPVCTETCMGYANNVYKLCLMLRQSNPVEFYNLYLNTNGGTLAPKIGMGTIDGRTTGVLTDDTIGNTSKLYWGEHSFLPVYPDGSKPSYLSQENYRNYLNGRGFLISWIAGGCHDAVLRNTYSYNGTSNIVQYFMESRSILDETYTPYDYNVEFFDYLEDKIGFRPADATPLQALEYLLNNRNNWDLVHKELRILELQPGNKFSLTVQGLRQLMPKLTGIIHLEQQTTSEFIGRHEDLNCTYDMIYVGANKASMKVDALGKTVYNDPALDGLVYLHVGDRIIGYDNLIGTLTEGANIIKAINYINFNALQSINRANILKGFPLAQVFDRADIYRYSGNDITLIKKQQLQEYVEAGLPVLLDKDLYECNTSVIDDSSNLFNFLCFSRGSEYLHDLSALQNISTYSASGQRLIGQLAEESIAINMYSKPVEYIETEPSTRITDRLLRFKFTITEPDAPPGSLYDWSLYVDRNADGRYIEEEIIAYGQSEADINITINRSLDEKYADAVPWKLKACRLDRPVLRTEASGFSAFTSIPLSELERLKTQINILQITSNNSTINLEQLMNPGPGRTSLFYQYTKDIEDFNVSIRTITVNDFLQLYIGAGKAYDLNRPEETDKLFFMELGEKKFYDMLILGFGDCYTDINNTNGALDNIKAFIESGRSVLFTHDTTSFVNLPQSDFNLYRQGLTFWGHGINRYFRNRLGLDRFGIHRTDADTTIYDTASMPSQAKNIYKSGALTRNGTAYPEVQGFTYSTLVAFGNPGNASAGFNPVADGIYNAIKDYPAFPTVGNQVKKGTNVAQYTTRLVTKVNEGQITSYPYDIPDSFQIGESHGQYYQLNIDDPEIMVWFCLSDTADGTGPYTASPNDTRNNYYIFSKGNVMYTVVGHSAIDAVVDEGTTPPYSGYEVKLFINTMIASYQAGVTAPKLRVVNPDAVINSLGEYVLYENPDLLPGTFKRIWFETEDINLIAGRLVVRIYYYDGAGQPVLATQEVFHEEDDTRAGVFTESGKEDGYLVHSGQTYYFDLAPEELTSFQSEGRDKFTITVTNESYNLKQAKQVNLVGRMLFRLD